MRKATLLLWLFILAGSSAAQHESGSSSALPTKPNICWTDTYYDGITLAFDQAASGYGATLVTLQVQPSFQREYAIIFMRKNERLQLLRTTFHEQLWHQLGLGRGLRKTREQCIEQAKAAQIDSVEIPADAEVLNALWTAFQSINLDSRSCQTAKGKCVYFNDGTSYVVRLPTGRSARVTETMEERGLRSENPDLLAWIHAVLRTAKEHHQQ